MFDDHVEVAGLRTGAFFRENVPARVADISFDGVANRAFGPRTRASKKPFVNGLRRDASNLSTHARRD